MKKWNWNEPITWKQSIIWGAIGGVISMTAWLLWFYQNEISLKLNALHDAIQKISKKD